MDGSAYCFKDELAEFASIRDREEHRTAKGKGKGRKSLPPERQTYPFSLRFTPAEREVVRMVARLAGSPAPATWARRALLEIARDVLARTKANAQDGY